MKLNETYLGVQYETQPILKNFFLSSHLDEKKRPEIEMGHLLAMASDEIKYDKSVTEKPWEFRVRVAHSLTTTPEKLYYLTNTVQEVASSIKFERIDLKWFNQLPEMSASYILNKDEFYRFNKSGNRINVLHYRKDTVNVVYDCYSVILNDGIIAMMPSQNKEYGEKFIKLLLFMELGQISTSIVKPNGKFIYGKKGDEKIKNETLLDVQLVNTLWNKIVIVQGGFTVRQHLRVQPCGPGRKDYKLVWVKEYTKDSYIRGAERLKSKVL